MSDSCSNLKEVILFKNEKLRGYLKFFRGTCACNFALHLALVMRFGGGVILGFDGF